MELIFKFKYEDLHGEDPKAKNVDLSRLGNVRGLNRAGTEAKVEMFLEDWEISADVSVKDVIGIIKASFAALGVWVEIEEA